MIQAGGENAWKTSVKAVFTAGFSDLMMILGLGFASLSAESMTMDAMHVPATGLGAAGFLLMAVGALGKLGAIPFHGWLYNASEDAPSPFMGLVPGGLNLLMGANLLSKFPGIFDSAQSGAMLLVLIAGAGTVVLAGMLSMSAGGFRKLAVALNVAQAGALVLGATSVAGGAFVYASIVAATQNDAPLALVEANPWAVAISLVAFTIIVLGFYAWTKAQAAVPAVPGDDAPTPESTFR
jgi:formate hydrogenlyase subunit 3/multisubunit Na+/H+ antiporter MnhD subunit